MKKTIRILIVLILFLAGISAASAQESTTVTLLHFSDYHAHAVPFYSEGAHDMAGVARAVGYLKTYADAPNTLILSGGDMVNYGSPAFSDKFPCEQWTFFNGLVQAMAFGNHDADYGAEVFAECQAQIDYPILASNMLDANGEALFQQDGKSYEVFELGDVKIGVFAVVGEDFERLLRAETMPAPDSTFGDRVETARETVRILREDEGVNAVVLIGHALYEDDVALAKAVPGIDLIFGTHAHRKEGLTQIPETETFIISPFQYLTYISQVAFTFVDGELMDVSGELVKMDTSIAEDPDIAAQVDEMHAALALDPDYEYLFLPIGEASVELGIDGQNDGEGVLGSFVSDVIRESTEAHLAIFTASGFREPIPPGEILENAIKTAMPYENAIYVYEMTGAQVQELLDFSVSARGSDFFSQVSGVRFNIVDATAANVQILSDPADVESGYISIDPAQTYQVATSNFQGLYAGGYKDIFAPAPYTETGKTTWDEVRAYLQANSPVSPALDGRITEGAPPAVPTETALPEPTATFAPEESPTEAPAIATVEEEAEKTPCYLPQVGAILAVILVAFWWWKKRRVG